MEYARVCVCAKNSPTPSVLARPKKKKRPRLLCDASLSLSFYRRMAHLERGNQVAREHDALKQALAEFDADKSGTLSQGEDLHSFRRVYSFILLLR